MKVRFFIVVFLLPLLIFLITGLLVMQYPMFESTPKSI